MTEEFLPPEHARTLQALGQVEPPAPGVLTAAREVLWSAVAGEMLLEGPTDNTSRARAPGTDRSRGHLPRHRADPGS